MKQMLHILITVLKGGKCMTRIIDEIFKRRKLIIMLFTLMLGYGIYSYFIIPKQEMPEIDTPYMVLSIEAPSMSASNIENEIVDDIEKLIMTYPDVTDVSSSIYDHYAVVLIVYSFSTDDPDALSIEIYEKVNDLSLSENITSINYSSNFDDPHIIFSVHSDTLSEVELLSHAQEFRNELLLIEEISNVQVDSVFNKEVVVTLNSEALALYQLTIFDVYGLVYANSLNLPLGGVKTDAGTISITGNVTYDDLSLLEDMVIIPEIPTVTTTVTLGDISTIEIKDTSTKTYEFNGEQVVFLSVYFDKNIDFTKMGDEVLESKTDFLDEVNIGALSIDEMLFLPDYVNQQINDVFYSLLIAIVIVMIIVLLGIGFRNSLLIIVTIPIIIFTSVAVLYLTGFEIHKLTIVGLIVSIGIIVDNQIVITEGIKRNIDQGMEKVFAAKKAIRDNLGPVLSSTLTTVAAFVVIVFLPGFLGEIVSSMPLTVIIAITLSFIIAMTLSPVIATIFLKANMEAKPTSIHEIRIKKMIGSSIKYPFLWLFISFSSLAIVVYFAFTLQPIDLYPNDERSVIYIDYENQMIGDQDSTITLRDSIVDIIEKETRMINYATSIGGNLPNFHFSAKLINEQPHIGRLYINYDFNEEELLAYKAELENELSTIDNSKITVNVLELSPPIAPVVVFLQSKTNTNLTTVTEQLLIDIEESNDIKTFTVTKNTKSLKYFINYDFEMMSSMFITKAQIDQLIAIELNGFDLEIYEFNSEIINVNINSDSNSTTDILELQIFSETLNQSFPLSTFITISEEIDFVVIHRLNNQQVSKIDLYPVEGVDNYQLETSIKTLIDDIEHPGVKVTFGGENEMFDEISGDLIRASIIALIAIYIIMFIQFNNFVKPLIVYLTIPLSFTGSFLFLILFNEPITATALVGMVSLLGVTVNTGILLVEYISRSHHGPHDIKDACVNAVYLRFRPIMLTSTTTILGLIPLMITGGNFFRPMAISFMGGLITSTLITIFLIPSVYHMLYKKKKS